MDSIFLTFTNLIESLSTWLTNKNNKLRSFNNFIKPEVNNSIIFAVPNLMPCNDDFELKNDLLQVLTKFERIWRDNTSEIWLVQPAKHILTLKCI